MEEQRRLEFFLIELHWISHGWWESCVNTDVIQGDSQFSEGSSCQFLLHTWSILSVSYKYPMVLRRRGQVYHPAADHAPRALGVMLSLLAAVRSGWLKNSKCSNNRLMSCSSFSHVRLAICSEISEGKLTFTLGRCANLVLLAASAPAWEPSRRKPAPSNFGCTSRSWRPNVNPLKREPMRAIWCQQVCWNWGWWAIGHFWGFPNGSIQLGLNSTVRSIAKTGCLIPPSQIKSSKKYRPPLVEMWFGWPFSSPRGDDHQLTYWATCVTHWYSKMFQVSWDMLRHVETCWDYPPLQVPPDLLPEVFSWNLERHHWSLQPQELPDLPHRQLQRCPRHVHRVHHVSQEMCQIRMWNVDEWYMNVAWMFALFGRSKRVAIKSWLGHGRSY